MSNLARIVAQRADFDTCQIAAWTDGFPIIGQAGSAGIMAGTLNVGNGSVVLTSVAPGTQRGAHTCLVTAVVNGLTRFTVTDPDGDVTGSGVVGLPVSAGGLVFTVSQGTTPFAVGDAFSVAVLTAPLDLTGLDFTLDARVAAGSPTRTFFGASAPVDGSQATLIVDPAAGAIANFQRRVAMSRQPPGDYPYTVVASDPTNDPEAETPVIVFYGTIRHRAVLSVSPTTLL